MFERYMVKSLVYVFIGGLCLSLSSAYADNASRRSGPNPYNTDVRPNNRLPQPTDNDSATGKEEIAYEDDPQYPRDQERMGDWDYRENWQYHRDAYFTGETQADAYRKAHPDGTPGIGYDVDEDARYIRDQRRTRYRNNQSSPNRELSLKDRDNKKRYTDERFNRSGNQGSNNPQNQSGNYYNY